MDRKDIIRMAREAGGLNCDCCLPEPEPHEMQEFIERFAALVAARPWVGLTDEELEAAFYHVEYDTTFSYQKEPDKWCKAFYQYVDRLLEEKNT